MKLRVNLYFLLALFMLIEACSSQKPISQVSQTTVNVKPQVQIKTSHSAPYMQPYKLPGEWTVADILQLYGKRVMGKLDYYFTKANVSYPPKEVTFIALKQEKKLELWARDRGEFRFIRDYHIMAASGDPGPKLHQGDRQVPEGIYRITELNPNSHYHLSMRINYPNEFDLYHAEEDKRTNLGSDIFIHGKDASIGCIAMGDEVIKELFVLTAQVGSENVKVVIAPHDPRAHPLVADSEDLPEWTRELYSIISHEIYTLATPSVKSAKTGL